MDKLSPVAWTKTYEGKPYSNVLVFEKPENDLNGWYPLYLHPQEIWKNKVYIWQVWDEELGAYYIDIDRKTARDIPLYTHPAQDESSSSQQARLVPLSDDELKNVIYAVEDKFGMSLIGGIAIARAIEQAHGIGVKDED
jgi:hypothetical protein